MILDLVLASVLLLQALVAVVGAFATPARRARAGAGGALHPAFLMVLAIPVSAVLFADALGHSIGGFGALAMVPFLLITLVHQRRLDAVPDEKLSPQMRWLRSNGSFTALNPRRTAAWWRGSVEHVWGKQARLRHKDWERAQGLR